MIRLNAAGEPIPEPTTDDGPDTALPSPATPVATLIGVLLLVLAGVAGVRRLPLR